MFSLYSCSLGADVKQMENRYEKGKTDRTQSVAIRSYSSLKLQDENLDILHWIHQKARIHPMQVRVQIKVKSCYCITSALLQHLTLLQQPTDCFCKGCGKGQCSLHCCDIGVTELFSLGSLLIQ